MKEVQSLLKLVSDGLRTLARGVDAIAEKVNEADQPKSPARPAGRKKSAAVKKTRSARKAEPAAAKESAVKSPTAAQTVETIISRAKKGVDTAAIKEKKGYNQKKVANIVFKLKKQGKIKTLEKGVYTKA
jgi:predicted Rossmann fold nucleotide-binding protein DprA/Smf involved in DNA uptake